MEKKQTAVEWLKYELEQYGSPSSLNVDWETLDQLVQQAKEIEKQQMLDMWQMGIYSTQERGKSFDQYYNENYEKETNRS